MVGYSTDVPDGATQRHSRMMELLTFINVNTPPGATITHIQSHMLKLYGLKFKTTSEMVQELAVSAAIKVDGHGFYRLTDKQQTVFKTLVAQEKAEDLVGPLVRRIDRVKNDKARVRLERLAAKLTTLLQEVEEKEGV
jgi:hypothetical protein